MKPSFVSIITTLLFVFTCQTMGLAQNYDPLAPVPLEEEVIYGQLDNGLTYYIRHNPKPENRAEFYLVLNVGSVQENEDQNGLAHFCEHMAFNGTEHFEKHQILDYLRSIGMEFGPEINAFTSYDVTTYMLQKVPVDVPENIDTSLLILYDWAGNIAFEDEEIDNERGVIHEEWRIYRGAMYRMWTKAEKVVYQDSKYAERDVIGDIEIIDNFEYETLRSFYNDWYRPELMAVIAVGDFDPQVIKEKIQGLFSQLPVNEEVRKREYYPIPDHDRTLVTVQTDKEAQYSILRLLYKHDVPLEKNTGYYRKSLLEELFNSMMNARLSELLLSENPPFIYGYSRYDELVRTKDAYESFAVTKDDQMEEGLEAFLIENERVKKYGFTETELDRAKMEMLSGLEKLYNERDKQESENFVWQYWGHFLNQEPSPGIAYDYEFVKEVLPGIGLFEINELAGEWITDHNRVVVLMAPEKEGLELPSEERLLEIIAGVKSLEIEPYIDKVSDQPLIAVEPVPSPVAKTKKLKDLDAVSWTFDNGIRVVLKPTEFKADEIRMTAYSLGGTSLYPVDQLISANFASNVTSMSGVGQFDQVTLDKKMAGKEVYVNPYIGNLDEGFSGTSTPKDLETMLQLVYLYFTDSRQDEISFNSLINRYKGFLENKALDPASTLQDTVTVTMANYHKRVRPMTAELLDEADLKKTRHIFNERFGDPGSFTFYFVGNLDLERDKPLFEKYLGGLPKVVREESFRDNMVRPPAGFVEKVVSRNMEEPKGTVNINFSGIYDFDNYQERMNLSALCDILDIKYTETVREEEGGTYGVGVRLSQIHYPYEHYNVRVQFDCDPGNAEKLKDVIYTEIQKIQEEGPTAKDLGNVKENKLKVYQENLKKNRYWLNKLKSLDYDNTDVSQVVGYEKYLENITAESIQAAAQAYLGDNVVEIILMPENISDNTVNPMIDKK